MKKKNERIESQKKMEQIPKRYRGIVQGLMTVYNCGFFYAEGIFKDKVLLGEMR